LRPSHPKRKRAFPGASATKKEWTDHHCCFEEEFNKPKRSCAIHRRICLRKRGGPKTLTSHLPGRNKEIPHRWYDPLPHQSLPRRTRRFHASLEREKNEDDPLAPRRKNWGKKKKRFLSSDPVRKRTRGKIDGKERIKEGRARTSHTPLKPECVSLRGKKCFSMWINGGDKKEKGGLPWGNGDTGQAKGTGHLKEEGNAALPRREGQASIIMQGQSRAAQ